MNRITAAISSVGMVSPLRFGLKLKRDDKGNIATKEENGVVLPIYIDDKDGKELAFDAEQMYGKIASLNTESKNHRLKAEALEEQMKAFGSAKPEDVTKIIQAVTEIGGLEGIAALQKKAGLDVEGLKKSMTDAFTQKNQAIIDGYEQKLADATKNLSERDNTIFRLMVSGQLATSKFVAEKLIIPPDLVEKAFGSNFKVEDGKVVAYLDGKQILSREKPGELASVDEALSVLVDNYPMKNHILKSKTQQGSGGDGNKGGGDFSGLKRSAMTEKQKSDFVRENGREAFQSLPL